MYLHIYTHAHTHAHTCTCVPVYVHVERCSLEKVKTRCKLVNDVEDGRVGLIVCVCKKVSGPAHRHFNRGGQPAGETFIRPFCVLYFVGILDFALTNSCCLCDLSYFKC